MNARMLTFTLILMGALPSPVEASGHGAEHGAADASAVSAAVHAAGAHGQAGDHEKVLATEVSEGAHGHASASSSASEAKGAVAALEAGTGRAFREGEMIEAAGKALALVDRKNAKFDLSPGSVAEFNADGFRLLRGSAIAESAGQSALRTSGARIDFNGRVAVSYDHRESSTSAFVLEGEARVVNAHGEDQSLRLERFRGATLVVGEVMPQLVRQLDVGAVRTWLLGYAWGAPKVDELLRAVPEAMAAAPARPAPAEAKLEEYFSAIDGADEAGQPDYYDRKFQDPDLSVAAANQPKEATAKALTPEAAALIVLPSTAIDLGFNLPPQVITAEEKDRELAAGRAAPAKSAARAIASVKKSKGHAPASVKKSESGDPEIDEVLGRLRGVRAKEPVISSLPEYKGPRSPSSVKGGSVPDPVYDFSQNF